jgi:ribosome assembly protein 4
MTRLLLPMPLQGHRKFISSIAWEPAHVELPSRRFCSGSKDATIKVWEATTR